jgi:hypothetical protein
MTSRRVGFLGLFVVVAVAACARSQRVAPSVNGEGGAGDEAGGGGTGGSAGRSSSNGGASGKGGAGGPMAADAGEAGSSRGGGSSGAGASAGRGGSSEGGASGEAGAAGVDGVDSVLEINDAEWAAFCQMLFDCPMIESDEVPGFRALLGDEATCREVFQGSITGRGVSDLTEAVEQGRVVLKLDQLPACLEAWSSCDFWRDRQAVNAVCRRVYLGTQATGEACFRDEECADGRCVVADTCPGTCQPLGAPGAVCANDDDCDGSSGQASCELMGPNVPDACYVATLLPPVGEGEECWKASEGEDRQPCATGLWCEGDGIYPAAPGSGSGDEYRRGICRSTPIPGGEACNDDEDICELGYSCRGEDTDHRCEAMQVVSDAGAPCGGEAGFCNVFERLECVGGFCERVTDGLEGSSCQEQQLLGYRACEPGLVCIAMGTDDPITAETPQTCLPPRAAGESCRRDHECASETCGPDNRCADRFCETARQWF